MDDANPAIRAGIVVVKWDFRKLPAPAHETYFPDPQSAPTFSRQRREQ